MPRASWMALAAVSACLLSAAAPAFAADGDLDPEFDYDGVQHLEQGFVANVALQPDGRIVAAGSVPGGDVGSTVFRLTSTGALDETFGDGGSVSLPNVDSVGDVAVQADGRIVVVGAMSPQSDAGDAIVARLLPDGNPDPAFDGDGQSTFDFGAGGYSFGRALALGPSGTVVVAGDRGNDFGVARLTATGGLDAGFSGDGRTTEDVGGDVESPAAVALQGDAVVVAGRSNAQRTSSTDASKFAAIRLTAGGARDASFGTGGSAISDFGTSSGANGVIATPDGGLLLSGVGQRAATGRDLAVLKLGAGGLPDPGFGDGGRQFVDVGGGANESAFEAGVSIDGKLLVAGGTGSRLAVAKLTGDGRLDPSFGDGGRRVYESVGQWTGGELARQADGDIVLGGFDGAGMVLARVTDSLPVATLTAPTIDEGRVAPFTVTLNKTAGYPVSMSFVTGDGSANAGEDYAGRSGTLTIPAGQRAGVIAVSTTLDRLYEAADEDFRIELDNLVGATFDVRIAHATLRNVLRRGRCANTVIGRRGTDIITGSPAGDLIRGRQDADVLFGLGGDDCILGERGGDQIRGGDGDDRLEGGSGDDEIKGEDGKDRIVGGRGRNRYSGGAGNDRIYARNGRAEIVECGPGRDYAKVDRTDKLRRCERVARSRG